MPNINIDDVYILDETGAQVDKVTGLFTKDENTTNPEKAFAQLNIGTAGSNRNLLDNAYFVGGGSQLGDGIFPINQRGQTSYTGAAATSVDRWWQQYDTNVQLTSAGLRITGVWDIKQRFARPLPDGTYTLSVDVASKGNTNPLMMNLNASYQQIDSFPITQNGINTCTFTSDSSNQVQGVAINLASQAGADITIRAMKLEKGTVSTLANDAPPDYWQELDKCLYYFERITNNGSGPITIGAGFADGANALYAPVRIHRKRAGISTISTSGAIYAGQRSPNISVSSVTQYNSTPDGIITLLANAPSSFTSNEYYRLVLGAGAHIDFSADL